MTPDKIFIDEDLIAYHCLTDRHDGDVEYIRKDALLEWAKEQKEKLVSSDSFTTQGKRKMLERIIGKLNSM